VVDDNPEAASSTASMLKQFGYSVHVAHDGNAALQALERQSFELVVSDIVMAGAGGISLARTIRERKPELPVMLVTGYADRARDAGAEFVLLQKPLEGSEVSRYIARLIAESKHPPDTNVVRLREARKSPASKGMT
jgi:CheY-like chemotaxis protein